MDQNELEQSGVGFRCRGCGISVFGVVPPAGKFCTACQQQKPRLDPHSATVLRQLVLVHGAEKLITAIKSA